MARTGGNEVWFTQADVNPTGEPVRITGLTSTAGGTQITLSLPASAEPGDVLVHKPGAGGDTLSNAFPFAPSGCGEPATYCTAKLNSQGCTPAIASSGTPSATNPAPFLVTASKVINNKTGILVYAFAAAATPFQGGTLCLGGSLKRTPAQNSFGNPGADDCSGNYSFDFNARIQSGIDPALVVGVNVYAQYLSRDTADPFGLGLTDAVVFTICPQRATRFARAPRGSVSWPASTAARSAARLSSLFSRAPRGAHPSARGGVAVARRLRCTLRT